MEKKFTNCANDAPTLCPHYDDPAILKVHQHIPPGDYNEVELAELKTILNNANIICVDCESFSPVKC